MDSHWGKNNVGTLTHMDIINGFPDGSFRPNDTLQLDQFIKLIIEALNIEVEPVSSGYWAMNHIRQAFEEELLLGEVTGMIPHPTRDNAFTRAGIRVEHNIRDHDSFIQLILLMMTE